MNKKYLIWFLSFMLLVSSVFAAFPYFMDGNMARIGNETFNTDPYASGGNWTYFGGTACTQSGSTLSCAAGTSQRAGYIHKLINTSNTANYTFFESNISSTCAVDGAIILSATSGNGTGGGTSGFQIGRLGSFMRIRTFPGGTSTDIPGTTGTNDIVNLKIVYNVSSSRIVVNINGTDKLSVAKDGGFSFVTFGAAESSSACALAISGFASYNSSIYNTSSTSVPTASPNLTLTAIDYFDGAILNNISVTIQNGTETHNYSTINGSLLINDITNGIYNLTVRVNDSGGYFPQTWNYFNITSNSFQAKLYQSILYANASILNVGTGINNFGIRTNGSSIINLSNSTGMATLFLKRGVFEVIGNSTPYFNTSNLIILSPLEERKLNINFSNVQLRISVRDIFSNQSVNSFTATVTGLNVSYSNTLSTTNGNATFNTIDGLFNVVVNGSFASKEANITVIPSLTNYTFYVFSQNSIYIRIYDEGTSTLITSRPVRADLSSSSYVGNLSTLNGTIYAQNILPDIYTVSLSSSGYTTRDYYLTLNSGSNVELNAYLANSSTYSDITFTLKDAINLQTISGMTMSVSDRINLTWVTIAQKVSDIAGQVIFSLDQNNLYRFTITGSDYSTKVFDLQPTSTSYTINLDPAITADFSTIFGYVSFTTLPNRTNINPTSSVNFSLITTSLNSATQSYFGLNTSYYGTTYLRNVTGSPAGGTGSLQLNLANYSFNSLTVTYFIKVDGQELYPFDITYYFSNVTATNQSVVGAAETIKQKAGQGWLPILAVIITILVMASFKFIGLSGNKLGFVGAMCMGVFTYLQWLNPNVGLNYIIGSIITITLMGGYFLLNRLGD